jgi:hypothetical protein
MSVQKQAFIILCHKEPAQVEALVRQLLLPGVSFFFIHVDQRASEHFDYISAIDPGIRFTRRYPVQWGRRSMLEATMAAIEGVISSGIDFSHVHLISGEDLLVRPAQEFYDFFSQHKQTSYMDYTEVPKRWKHRYQLFHFGVKRERPLLSKLFFFSYKQVVKVLPWLKRPMPYHFKPYMGSQWWSLSFELVKAVHEFSNAYPLLFSFMKHVQIPDELFFQTVVLNQFTEFELVNSNLRYIDWNSPGRGRPAYLDSTDLKKIEESGAFFARKIDFSKNPDFYQRLHAGIH